MIWPRFVPRSTLDSVASVARSSNNSRPQIAGAVPKDALSGFAFVGLDTHPYEATDDFDRPEYLALSIGVSPSDVAARDKVHLGWYEEVMNGFPAGNISGGANQLKPVGRLAFRNLPILTQYLNMLTSVSNQLRTFRDSFKHGRRRSRSMSSPASPAAPVLVACLT